MTYLLAGLMILILAAIASVKCRSRVVDPMRKYGGFPSYAASDSYGRKL